MQNRPARDPLSRAAIRQMIWLGVGGAAVFVILLIGLGVASGLTGGGAASGRAFDIESGTVTRYLSSEPPQLDSTRATDTVSGMLIGHLFEGLLGYGPDNEIVAGVAERWEITTEKATFWLREDARWSDGVPVTAHDFVFSWRKVVDPENASEYAFIMYYVKNAEAINTGDMPVEQLGVRALDDRTLEVDLERPVAFFDKLVAFGVYSPIREDFYLSRDGRYAADAEDMVYNGPFMMTRWVHGANVRLEKNPHYWNRDAVRLNAIDFAYITSDTNALFNLFKDGAIVSTGLGAEQLEQAMALRFDLHRYNDGSVFYIDFNFREGRPTTNYHLRRAMQLVADSGELVHKVIGLPGYIPARSLFPTWLQGLEGPFREEYPPPRILVDPVAAREHLELAKQELGLDEIPPLVLLTDDSPISNKQSEYFQNLFSRTLGLEIRIDKQIFKQRLEKMTAGDFDMVMAGWGPDYADPLTYGDLYASWNGNNRGRYNNPALDAQVRIAQSSLDQQRRMEAFAEIQRILIDDAAQIYNYERGIVFVQVPELRGVVNRQISPDPDYTGAWLEALD